MCLWQRSLSFLLLVYSLLLESRPLLQATVSSYKPIRSASSQCLAVPSAAADAVDCDDTPLVDDAVPCHLDRQMSQDSILSVGQTHAIVLSTLCDRSGPAVAPIK